MNPARAYLDVFIYFSKRFKSVSFCLFRRRIAMQHLAGHWPIQRHSYMSRKDRVEFQHQSGFSMISLRFPSVKRTNKKNG